MTPDEFNTHIEQAQKLRKEVEYILKEEIDSINVMRELCGLRGKVYWSKSIINGEQKKCTYFAGSAGILGQSWRACIRITINRYRYGVDMEVHLDESQFGINLKTKCKAIMNKSGASIKPYSTTIPGNRDFFLKISDPNEIRQFFKIFLKVEVL